MNKFIFLLTLMLFCMISQAQTFVNKDSLFEQSKKENKVILMHFSGSDWCANCIRFEKKVLKDSVFQNFLHDNLLFLNVDFPQRKKQSDELKKQNELLAEQYNPEGIFPTLLLFSSDKKTIPVSYQQENTAEFIDKIKKALITLKEMNGAQN